MQYHYHIVIKKSIMHPNWYSAVNLLNWNSSAIKTSSLFISNTSITVNHTPNIPVHSTIHQYIKFHSTIHQA